MKTLVLAFLSFLHRVRTIGNITTVILTGLVVLFAGCAPGIDFSKHGTNELTPPENTGTATDANGATIRRLECGRLATYQVAGVDGLMGVITLHTYRNQPGAAAAHCSVKVKIVLKAGAVPVAGRDTIIRIVQAGESMTEVTRLTGANNMEVIVKCEGPGSACVFADPVFQSGKDEKKPVDRFAELTSNPVSSRVYVPQGTNKCKTDEIVLHKIYLDQYDPEKVGLELVAVSRCNCASFRASIRDRGNNGISTALKNARGNVVGVAKFRRSETVVIITGSCGGTGVTDVDCVGDAEIKIVGKP